MLDHSGFRVCLVKSDAPDGVGCCTKHVTRRRMCCTEEHVLKQTCRVLNFFVCFVLKRVVYCTLRIMEDVVDWSWHDV